MLGPKYSALLFAQLLLLLFQAVAFLHLGPPALSAAFARLATAPLPDSVVPVSNRKRPGTADFAFFYGRGEARAFEFPSLKGIGSFCLHFPLPQFLVLSRTVLCLRSLRDPMSRSRRRVSLPLPKESGALPSSRQESGEGQLYSGISGFRSACSSPESAREGKGAAILIRHCRPEGHVVGRERRLPCAGIQCMGP